MNNRQRQSRRIQFPAINRAHRHCPRCGRFLLLVNKQPAPAPAPASTRRASSLERPSDSKSSKARFDFAERRGALKMPPEITTFILMTTSYYTTPAIPHSKEVADRFYESTAINNLTIYHHHRFYSYSPQAKETH